MATIQTCHPYSHLETPYEYWDEAMSSDIRVSNSTFYNTRGYEVLENIAKRPINKILSLPLFRDHTSELVRSQAFNYGASTNFQYYVRFDTIPSKQFRMGMYNDSDCYGFDIYGHYSMVINAVYRSFERIYSRGDVPLRDNINYDLMERYRMTTYVSRDTNAFWFPNSNQSRTTKQMLTKVVNIENPANTKYFYASFNYMDNVMRFRGLSDSSWDYYYDTGFAYVWNGSDFTGIFDASQTQGGASNSFVLRPFILGEWQFVDIFTIEGGIPAYNTCGATLRINDEDYIYLTNTFLLKVTN